MFRVGGRLERSVACERCNRGHSESGDGGGGGGKRPTVKVKSGKTTFRVCEKDGDLRPDARTRRDARDAAGDDERRRQSPRLPGLMMLHQPARALAPKHKRQS
ncbi:unnamed protein product [Lampetra planeri]